MKKAPRIPRALAILIAALLALGLAASVAVSRRFEAKREAGERAALAGLRGGPPALGVLDGYRFGAIALDAKGLPLQAPAAYAVPEVYGVTGTRTFIADASGRVWAKDQGNNVPPAVWPSAEPASAGWILLQ